MFFCEVNFAARRFGLAAVVMLGLPAAAQQAIQFSKPVDADPDSKANAFMPDAARRNPASFNAPSPIFTIKTPEPVLMRCRAARRRFITTPTPCNGKSF